VLINPKLPASEIFPKLGRSLIENSANQEAGNSLSLALSRCFPEAPALARCPDKLSGQFVYVDAPKIIELLTPKTENSRTADRRDVDALAVEDFSIHRTQSYFAFTLSPSSTRRRISEHLDALDHITDARSDSDTRARFKQEASRSRESLTKAMLDLSPIGRQFARASAFHNV
jgi:hypothetical protein